MIDLNLSISNPWSNRWDILWNKSGFIGKNKAWEFNGYRTNQIIDVDFNVRPKGDHAGARVMLGLLSFNVELHFYDVRHWNYTENRFYEPTEQIWPD
jgi:hypothetical protein